MFCWPMGPVWPPLAGGAPPSGGPPTRVYPPPSCLCNTPESPLVLRRGPCTCKRDGDYEEKRGKTRPILWMMLHLCWFLSPDWNVYGYTIIEIYGCTLHIQGGFFNCSHPNFSKYKKKTNYSNCSHPKMSKYKQKTKYPNCSHPKMSKCGNQSIGRNKHRIFSSDSFTLFLHMRELSPEKCELLDVLQGWEQFGYFNFFLSLFFSGWEQFAYSNFFLSLFF